MDDGNWGEIKGKEEQADRAGSKKEYRDTLQDCRPDMGLDSSALHHGLHPAGYSTGNFPVTGLISRPVKDDGAVIKDKDPVRLLHDIVKLG